MLKEPLSVNRFALAFGRRLAQLRAARGFTQEDLGKRAGMHRLSVGHIERAQTFTSIDRLEDIATALDLTVRRLMPPSGGAISTGGCTLATHDLRGGNFIVGRGGHDLAPDRFVVLLDGDRPVAILTPADEHILCAIEDAVDIDITAAVESQPDTAS
jgi:DNA-binding XRE family transcriptional regulator